MLVTLKEITDLCEAKQCGAGAFNTPNLESVVAVLDAAQELNVPVIIQHAQEHEEFMPLDIMGPIMLEMAEKASVPVCVHLDHGETLDYIYKALKMGFTSAMYDGSILPFEENAANTKLVVSFAKKTGASVEAEIGCMGKRETGFGLAGEGKDPDKIYTDPKQAKAFVEVTGIDALACSFGTTHGVYLSKPLLDFSVVENVRKLAGVPVVMHGGSGVSEEDYKRAIKAGVRKINYYTYMSMAGGSGVKVQIDGVKRESPVMYHDIVSWGIQAMKANCREAMRIFALK